MALTFVATDLGGTVLGEITNADQRNVTLGQMRVPSAACTIPLNHYLANTLATTDCLLRVYRTDPIYNTRSLIFHGPVVGVEEQGQDLQQTIAVTAAGPFWRLTKRIIPGSDSKGGVSYGTRDLGQMATDILNACNGATNGFTGIWPGSLTATVNGAVDTWRLKNAGEAIVELAAGINSFEFVVTPTEPVNRAAAWPQIGTLDIAPVIGASRPDVIFEYGTSRANVQSYSRIVARDGLLNRAIIGVSGWPDGTAQDLIVRTDATSQTTHGLFEEVINDAGITDDGLRTELANYHIAIRKDPRQTITISPSLNARPSPFVDYNVGDFVRARAIVDNTVRFDVTLRIWGLAMSADVNGNETADLTLVSG